MAKHGLREGLCDSEPSGLKCQGGPGKEDTGAITPLGQSWY